MNTLTVRKSILYSLVACAYAYMMAAVIIFLFGLAQTGWKQITGDFVYFIVNMLTLSLADFPWWGNVWYLAVLVPWLGSSLLFTLLLFRFNNSPRQRHLLGGGSTAIYYFVMFAVLVIGRIILWWGNIQPQSWLDIALYLIVFAVFVGGGFLFGFLSAVITDKVIKF